MPIFVDKWLKFYRKDDDMGRKTGPLTRTVEANIKCGIYRFESITARCVKIAGGNLSAQEKSDQITLICNDAGVGIRELEGMLEWNPSEEKNISGKTS
jgi:hypothetical protein